MTVGDLVAHLQQVPQDFRIVIEDADTGWLISTIHIRVDQKDQLAPDVTLYGLYEEMEG